MRLIYPQDIKDEREAMIPYLEYREGQGVVLKPGAPACIVQRYRLLKAKIEDFKKRHR